MFDGFSPQTTKFLKQLSRNNNRDWFNDRKSRYEEHVLFPALELVADIEAPLRKVSGCFTAVAKRSGGSIMRIYRDTRFSKDKTPYKTNLGIHFRHEVGKDVHAPGFYFHIDPDDIFFAAGIWHPQTGVLSQIRAQIDEDSSRWKRVINSKKFKDQFERRGDSLKRPPRGYEATHPLIDDLKLKDHIAITPIQPDEILDRSLIDLLCRKMKLSLPYMRFLCDALQLPC